MEAVEIVEQSLRRAVAGQMVADVPVGAFLSGGIDSSLVVACMHDLCADVHIAGGELEALADIGYGGRLTRRGRLREGLTLRQARGISAASGLLIEKLAAAAKAPAS